MSQRILFEIIQSYQNGITRKQIKNEIDEKYPERSLNQYLGNRLQSLLNKEVIFTRKKDGETVYITSENPDFSAKSLSVSIDDIDKNVTEDELIEYGIEIVNIVGSGTIGENINLERFATEVSDVEYEPETSPMAVWRPIKENSATVLIPASGQFTIVGCDSRKSVTATVEKIEQIIPDFCSASVNKSFGKNIKINNVVGTVDLEREFDLNKVSVNIGLEKVEYNPEEFPGLVYNPKKGIVVLLFRSGSMVITASNTYKEVLNGYKKTLQDLESIGVEFKRQHQK